MPGKSPSEHDKKTTWNDLLFVLFAINIMINGIKV